MSTSQDTIEALAGQEYRYGFVTDVEADAHTAVASVKTPSGSFQRASTSPSGFSSGAWGRSAWPDDDQSELAQPED